MFTVVQWEARTTIVCKFSAGKGKEISRLFRICFDHVIRKAFSCSSEVGRGDAHIYTHLHTHIHTLDNFPPGRLCQASNNSRGRKTTKLLQTYICFRLELYWVPGGGALKDSQHCPGVESGFADFCNLLGETWTLGWFFPAKGETGFANLRNVLQCA